MARRKSKISKVKKTMHVLPKTAKFLETAASSRGIFEASIVDEAIALLMKKKEYAEYVDTY